MCGGRRAVTLSWRPRKREVLWGRWLDGAAARYRQMSGQQRRTPSQDRPLNAPRGLIRCRGLAETQGRLEQRLSASRELLASGRPLSSVSSLDLLGAVFAAVGGILNLSGLLFSSLFRPGSLPRSCRHKARCRHRRPRQLRWRWRNLRWCPCLRPWSPHQASRPYP